MGSWVDADVTAIDPLRVRVDGDVSELPFTPDSLIDVSLLSVDDRVRCEWAGQRLIVHGRAGGVAPMRLSFADKTALDAFTGWPGLIGFVEDTLSEYLWTTGWVLWSMRRQAFTPAAWTNWTTVGDATTECKVTVAAGIAEFEVTVTVGSTSSAWGDIGVTVPSSLARGGPTDVFRRVGGVRFRDVSASKSYQGLVETSNFNMVTAFFRAFTVTGSSIDRGAVSAVFTSAVGDVVQAQWSWALA